ncbi:MAG: FxsA family protein [Candidatus Nanohaloarchaea archaeon]
MIGYIIAFLILPFVDLYILVQLAGMIGFVQTLAIVLVTGTIGAYYVRREGRIVMTKLGTSVTAQEVSRNLVEGVLLVLGGLLLISPGLVTDFLGFLIVFRLTRERLMLYLIKRIREKGEFQVEFHSL